MEQLWKVFIIALTAFAVTAKTIRNDEKYRLPDDNIPFHYLINLTVTEASFYGRIQMSFTTLNSTSQVIQLHTSPKTLYIQEIVFDYIYSCNSTIDTETEIMTVKLGRKLTKGNHTLTIDFIGIYPKEQYLGLYKTVYDNNGVNNWYVSTQFEPTYARRAFPCFDEPEYKAPMDIIISHPAGTNVLANTPAVNVTYTPQGTAITEFETTPPMSTYTVAFVVSHLAKSDIDASSGYNFNYSVYSRPNMKKYTGTADRYGALLVDMLGAWTGIKYEDMGDSQISQVAVMNFDFGAMENWGLVIYKEEYLLDEGVNTTNLQLQKIVMTMAHELAHQWFGNLVTLDWWSDAWLNEGFATYCQYYIPGSSKFINMFLEEQFTTDIVQAALNLDAYSSSTPLSSDGVETEEQDLAKFDAISYKKGGSVIRMLRSILGNENFQKGVHNYLNSNKYGNANPITLLTELDKIYKNSEYKLVDVMKNWIYESGYPVLTVSLSDDKKIAIVAQEQFVYNPSNDTDHKEWYVPVSYTTSEEKKFDDVIKTWLKPKENLTLELNNATWILLNMQRTGFYRVYYATEILEEFTGILKSKDKDEIHVSNRAQLVDDMLAFGRSGHLKYEKVFELLEYLKDETEYQPWVSAFKGFSYLLEKFENEDDITKLLKGLVLDWIQAAFPSITNQNATHLEIIRNSLITQWKCMTDNEDCLKTAKEEFNTFISANYITDYNDRDTVLCYGFRNSKHPSEDYKTLLKKYEETESTSEATSILSAIGCSDDSQVLTTYIKEIIEKNSVIAKQDTIIVYRVVAGNKKGIDVALDFVAANIEKIIKKNDGAIDIDDVISALADKVTTDKQREKLQKIIFDNRVKPGMDAIGAEAIERVNATLQWIDNYKDDMKIVLKKYSSSATSVNATFSIILSIIMMVFFRSL